MGVSPPGAGATGDLGENYLCRAWLGAGITQVHPAVKRQTSRAIKLHFFGSKMQRAPVCPQQGEMHPKMTNGGLIWGLYLGVQHCAGDPCAHQCPLFNES